MRPNPWLTGCLVVGLLACGDGGDSPSNGAGAGGAGGGQGGSAGPLTVGGPTIADGFDWSLPADVTAEPGTGWFLQGVTSDHPDIRHVGRTYYWADLNPADGVYDFSAWRQDLDEAADEERGLIARLKCSVTLRDSPWGDPGPFIPQWVLDACQPIQFDTASDIRVAVPWDDCLQQHYQTFVAQVGSEGILAEATLVGLYVHGISSSFGEEFWLTTEAIAAAEAAGMTAANLEQAFTDRIGWWATAAGDDVAKLAWVWGGIGWEFREASNAITNVAIDQGLGLRGGGLERYNEFLPPEAGQSMELDEAQQLYEGNITTDWTWPVRAEGRYLGDEIEVYDEFDPSSVPHAFSSSILRAVQLGMSVLWTHADAPSWAGDLVHWYTLVAGKRPAQAPDAVCWLREGYAEHRGFDYRLHNIEHLLAQRDLPGAETRPVDRFDRLAMWPDQDDTHFDYLARATTVTEGNDRLAFFLEPTFLASLTGAVIIKVTYWDDSDAEWVLEVSGTGGQAASSDPVAGQGDGTWRTATFELSSPPQTGALEQGADFRLRVTAGDDLTVRFVRVIR